MPCLTWTIAITYAGAEWTAYRSLLRQGITSYHAYRLDDARRGRWSQAVGRPQFPGYLFAASDIGQSFELIRQSIGIRGILRRGLNAVIVSEREMNTIREICDKRLYESVPRRVNYSEWTPGTVIAVPSGPFYGAPMIIARIDRGEIHASIGNLAVSFAIPAASQAASAMAHASA